MVFIVAAHMQVAVGAPVSQPVNQGGIAVKGKDDVLVRRKQRVIILVAQAVRMFACGLQPHQVDDINDADFQIRQMLAQD